MEAALALLKPQGTNQVTQEQELAQTLLSIGEERVMWSDLVWVSAAHRVRKSAGSLRETIQQGAHDLVFRVQM